MKARTEFCGPATVREIGPPSREGYGATSSTCVKIGPIEGEAGGPLVVRADVFPHLVMPVGPLVPALRAPVVQIMSNAAVPEDLGHPVGRPAVLPRTAASHEPDVTARVLMEKPGITLVSHVVDRVVEVEVVVVHPVHGIAQVVHAGERVAALHVVGMFEESIG